MMKEVVIIAGGLATRLGTLSQDTPKSLIDINGKPFIYYQLKLLEKNNIDHVVLCLGHLGEQVEEYVRQNDFKLNIGFSYDGNENLGTGGCIKKALSLLSDRFMVIYGDSYLDFDYAKLFDKFEKYNNPSIMSIYKNDNKIDKSNVRVKRYNFYYNKLANDDRRYEYIDYGANMFTKKCFIDEAYDFDKFELFHLQGSLQDKKQLDFYLVKNRFYEIGSIDGIEEFRMYIKEYDAIL